MTGSPDRWPTVRPRRSRRCARSRPVVLSLVTGLRTDEARALRWDHVELDVPKPFVAVWRSVRAGGDTKTPYVQEDVRGL